MQVAQQAVLGHLVAHNIAVQYGGMLWADVRRGEGARRWRPCLKSIIVCNVVIKVTAGVQVDAPHVQPQWLPLLRRPSYITRDGARLHAACRMQLLDN